MFFCLKTYEMLRIIEYYAWVPVVEIPRQCGKVFNAPSLFLSLFPSHPVCLVYALSPFKCILKSTLLNANMVIDQYET